MGGRGGDNSSRNCLRGALEPWSPGAETGKYKAVSWKVQERKPPSMQRRKQELGTNELVPAGVGGAGRG